MTLKNSEERWGRVSQLFHWLIVVLIVVMAWLGLTMTDLPNTPYKIRLYSLHKSIGLSLLGLYCRGWLGRAPPGPPRPIPGIPAWQERVASLTHFALYVLLLAIPLTGWIFNSAAGFPLQWFGVVNLPALSGRSTGLRELSGTWHEWLFWALIVLALVHAAAAIYHHLFQHDATLARMLPRNWLRIPSHDQETPHV
jgi:cytochrome b561